jgi:simple sugar transport system substrate-binding protein
MAKRRRFLGLTILAAAFLLIMMAGVVPAFGQVKEKPRVTIFTHGTAGDPLFAVIKKGAEEVANGLGIDMQFVFGYPNDLAKHAAMLDQVIASRPDAIVLADYYEVFDPLIKRGKAAGIRFFQIQKNPKGVEAGVEAAIGPYMTLYQHGYLAGQNAVKLLPRKGEKFHMVIPGEAAGATHFVQRSLGFRTALKDAGYVEGKDYTYDELDAGAETAITESRINSYLIGHPETKVVYCVGGITTERACVAIQKLGKKPGQILMFGNDLNPETALAIQKGYCQGVYYGQTYLLGFLSMVETYLVVKYNFAPFDMLVGAGWIDKSNIDATLEFVKKGVY